MARGQARATDAAHARLDRELAGAHGWAFEPFTQFRVPPLAGRYVNVSEHGFRHGNRGTVWPPEPGAVTVFVFGGSTAFGFELADEETIPSQLADRLAALAPEPRVAVYNFASPNYAGEHERIRLEQLLLAGHTPRVAIFFDGFDEFLWPYYGPAMLQPFVDAIPRPSTARLAATVARRVMGRLTGGRLDGRIGGRGAAGRTAPAMPEPVAVLDRYFRNKRLIEGACAQFGVQPLFVWQPVPCYHYDGEAQLPRLARPAENRTRDALLACIRRGYELMSARRDSAAAGDDFLWLADLQVGRSEVLYADFDHYTAAFSGEVAVAIAQHLEDCGWLRATPAGTVVQALHHTDGEHGEAGC